MSKNTNQSPLPCPHFGTAEGQCQNCSLMPLSPEDQAEYKVNSLKQILREQNLEIDESCFKPILKSEKTLAYRNRASLKTNGQQLGYISKNHNLVPIENCVILTEKMQKTLKKLLKKLPNPQWKPKGTHKWENLEFDDKSKVSEIMPGRRIPFKQGNDWQNQVMRDWLKNKIKTLDHNQTVMELFCGNGNFTEILADHGFESIYAFEANEPCIFELKRKKLPQVKAFNVNLYRPSEHQLELKQAIHAQTLVLDPPRDGFVSLKQFKPYLRNIQTIFYISCSPQSLAKDLTRLMSWGFQVEELQPLDLFPQTPHVETLVSLKKIYKII